MPDYDQSLKRIINKAPDGFLKIIAPDLQWREELSPELPSVLRQADLIWRVVRTTTGAEFTLHIELQVKPEDDIGERMAEYAIRLWRRDHVPVRSAVVFLKPVRSLPPSPFVMNCDGAVRLSYAFDTIALWTLSLDIVLSTPYYDLWPLAGIMGEVTTESVLDVAKHIIASPTSQSDRHDLTGVLSLLATLRLPQAAARAIMEAIPMIKDIWEESSLKDALAEMAAEKMMRRLVKKTIEGSFGALSDDISVAVDKADEALCENILVHIKTDSLEQVRQRLGLA